MRRSIQIVSACAFLMAAAGPVTGFGDGLAAEAEKLPCNNFCRTWMGFEGGEATAPQPSPAETVTAKPIEVSRDPASPVDDPASSSAKSKSASEADAEDAPSHPKPKRKAEPGEADVSDHRASAVRSKTSKLAKSRKLDDDTVAETRSGSEPSTSRPRLQADKTVKTPLRDHDATSSEPVKLMARDVPLPPRIPRAARPSRTGVAQAGPNAADEMRVGGRDGEPARAMPPSKTVRAVKPALNPDVAQTDVPHPAMGSVAAAEPKKASNAVDTVTKGAVTGGVTARVPLLAGQTITPAVAPPSQPDTNTARVASQAVAPPPALAASGESVSKIPSKAAREDYTVAAEGTAAARPASPKSEAVPAVSDPDTNANKVASAAVVPPPALAASGEPASKLPSDTAGKAPTVAVASTADARPASPEGGAVPAVSEPDTNATWVAPPAIAPSPVLAPTRPSAANSLPKSADEKAAVTSDGTAGARSSVGRPVAPASRSEEQAAPVASQVEVSHGAVVDAEAATRKTPQTTLGNEPGVVDAAASGATSVAARIGEAPSGHNDDHTSPADASSATTALAVTGLSVPVPEPAPVHPTDVSVAALNASPTVAEVVRRAAPSPLASPDATRQAVTDIASKAERPAPVASKDVEAPVNSQNGALDTIEDPHRAPPDATASIVVAPPPGSASVDENPATLVTIAIGDVSAKPEGTTIAYTITNPATAAVDLLFVRCNAVDPKGTIVGSAFDYVENIPAGQQVRRSVRLSSDLTISGQTFSCANDAATK